MSRLLEEFLAQIQMPSVSGQEGEFAGYLHRTFTDLGLETELDSDGNMLAVLKGNSQREPLCFAAHSDTVPTAPVRYRLEGDWIRTQGDSILSADDKAATSILVELVHALQEDRIPHGDLEILITCQEEVGLFGAKRFDPNRLRSQKILVLDHNGPAGGVIKSAPYANRLQFEFHGKAAHAGGEPERGISAIQAMSFAIARMPLGRIDEETTANIGIVSGGNATNIVPDFALAQGEARSRSQEKLERQTEAMLQAAKGASESLGANVKVDVKADYAGYALPPNDPLLVWLRAAALEIGLTFFTLDAGGASDANVFNLKGRKSVVLNCGYNNPHTFQEEASLPEMLRLLDYLKILIQRS
ncbi:MAG: M20/M25/M40 family metallo-hydrolase [Coprothermobacterota bacterium]|nr:M20/M25/M40 family metallo-hydrolase [Coprothermobacterota bacterium]